MKDPAHSIWRKVPAAAQVGLVKLIARVGNKHMVELSEEEEARACRSGFEIVSREKKRCSKK